MDVRVGGSYSLKVKACMPDGPEEMTVTGKYLEVRSPERLVFTWGWEGDEYTGSQVTVDFLALDGGTDLQLTHERLANAASRDRHTHGWTGTFDKLEKLLTPDAEKATAGASFPKAGEFCWNELLTSDVGVAGKFYTQLFGWSGRAVPRAGAVYDLPPGREGCGRHDAPATARHATDLAQLHHRGQLRRERGAGAEARREAVHAAERHSHHRAHCSPHRPARHALRHSSARAEELRAEG